MQYCPKSAHSNLYLISLTNNLNCNMMQYNTSIAVPESYKTDIRTMQSPRQIKTERYDTIDITTIKIYCNSRRNR